MNNFFSNWGSLFLNWNLNFSWWWQFYCMWCRGWWRLFWLSLLNLYFCSLFIFSFILFKTFKLLFESLYKLSNSLILTLDLLISCLLLSSYFSFLFLKLCLFFRVKYNLFSSLFLSLSNNCWGSWSWSYFCRCFLLLRRNYLWDWIAYEIVFLLKSFYLLLYLLGVRTGSFWLNFMIFLLFILIFFFDFILYLFRITFEAVHEVKYLRLVFLNFVEFFTSMSKFCLDFLLLLLLFQDYRWLVVKPWVFIFLFIS